MLKVKLYMYGVLCPYIETYFVLFIAVQVFPSNFKISDKTLKG